MYTFATKETKLPAAFIKALFTYVQRHPIQHKITALYLLKKRNINLLLITKPIWNDDVMKKKTEARARALQYEVGHQQVSETVSNKNKIRGVLIE